MPSRRLPTTHEAMQILASRRTRSAPRPPPPAGRSLAPLVRELDAKFGQGAGALQVRWREIVGADIARRTEPVKLIKGRAGAGASLEIRVDGPSAAIIQHQAQEILARVNLYLGDEAVQKLRVVQGPLRHKPEAPRAPARRIQPLDAAQEAQLTEGLAKAKDGRLRDALIRLGRGVLRQGR
jgi:hypothetical protein